MKYKFLANNWLEIPDGLINLREVQLVKKSRPYKDWYVGFHMKGEKMSYISVSFKTEKERDELYRSIKLRLQEL